MCLPKSPIQLEVQRATFHMGLRGDVSILFRRMARRRRGGGKRMSHIGRSSRHETPRRAKRTKRRPRPTRHRPLARNRDSMAQKIPKSQPTTPVRNNVRTSYIMSSGSSSRSPRSRSSTSRALDSMGGKKDTDRHYRDLLSDIRSRPALTGFSDAQAKESGKHYTALAGRAGFR